MKARHKLCYAIKRDMTMIEKDRMKTEKSGKYRGRERERKLKKESAFGLSKSFTVCGRAETAE